MTFHLERRESPDDGFRRIAREQIGFALAELGEAAMPADRKVHALRKRCKKLRGLLRLVRPLMGTAFEAEDRRFRDAAHRLAQMRDRSVQAETIGNLTDAGAAPALAWTPETDGALRDVREHFSEALAAVDGWPVELHGFADLAPGFAQTYRKCVETWDVVQEQPTDAGYHRLRKWAKYHWYHVRVLERVNRSVLRKRRRRLRKLQLALGDAHDLVLSIETLEAASPRDEALIEQATNRKHGHYQRARKRSRKLFSVSDDRLVADVAGGWVRWRD